MPSGRSSRLSSCNKEAEAAVRPETIARFWIRFCGGGARARLGGTCRRTSGTGTPSFDNWAEAGLWDVILAAFVESEASDNLMQMIDSTIVRAPHHAAGGRGGLVGTALAVRAAASRQSSMPGRMPKGLRSASL